MEVKSLKRPRTDSETDTDSEKDGGSDDNSTVAAISVSAPASQTHAHPHAETSMITIWCSDGGRVTIGRHAAEGTHFAASAQFLEGERGLRVSHPSSVMLVIVLWVEHNIAAVPRDVPCALELLVAADYYFLEGLVRHLSTWLAKHVRPCTALEVLVVTSQHGCALDDPASARAARVIAASLDQLLNTDAFLALPGDVLVSLLSHVDLCTALPEIKLDAAVAWVDQDATRACMLPALLARNIDDAPAASLAELIQLPLVSCNVELVTRIALTISTATFRPPRPHDHRFYLDATDQGDWLLFFGQTGTVTTQRAPRFKMTAQNEGHDAHLGPRRAYEMPATLDWTRLSSTSVPVSLAAAHDKRTGLVVLCNTAHFHSPIICYCLRSGTWKTLPALPMPRTGHAIVFMSGYVYAVGGTSESGNLLRETSRLRLARDGPSGPGGVVWETVAPLHAARSGHSATVMRAPTGPGFALVVFGGSALTSAPIESLGASGAGAGRWKQIWMANTRHRVGHAAIAVPTRNKTAQLLVIGGASAHDETETAAFSVNVADGAIIETPALTERYVQRPCAVRASGTIYAFGVYSPAAPTPVNVHAYNTETGGSELAWCSAYTEGAAVICA